MDVPRDGDDPGVEPVDPTSDGPADDGRARETGAGNGNGGSPQAGLPAILEEQELSAILEAMLFVSQDPLSPARLASVLGEVSQADLERAIQVLREDLERPGRGLQLVEVAGGYRIMTRPDYAPWLKRLEKVKVAPKVSRSALETLAIIAYKQPVVRGEIEQIRGVETSGVLRTLLERKLVRIVGRKEVPGRPIMYGTTKVFLEHFGLRDLAQLPPLREFKELGEPEQASLPETEDPFVIDGGPEPQVDESDSEHLGPREDSVTSVGCKAP